MNPFLGVVTDFSQVLHGVVIFRIKDDRRQKLLRALQALLDSRKCTPASASSMRGKLYFTAGTCLKGDKEQYGSRERGREASQSG